MSMRFVSFRAWALGGVFVLFSVAAPAAIERGFDEPNLQRVFRIPLVVEDAGKLAAIPFEWRSVDANLPLAPLRWGAAMIPALAFISYVSPKLGLPDHWAPNFMILSAIARLFKVPWIAFERMFLQSWRAGLDERTAAELRPHAREIRWLLVQPEVEYYVSETVGWARATPMFLWLKREDGQGAPELRVGVLSGYPDPEAPEASSRLLSATVPIGVLRRSFSWRRACVTALTRGLF